MAVTTFGRATHATRRAATAARSNSIIVGALVAGWMGIAATTFHILGDSMPIEQLVVALSALITGTVTFALWRLRGAALYKAFHEGVVAGAREQGRRGGRER